MSPRVVGAALLGLAAAVYGGVAVPARARAAETFAQHARLMEARRGARARLVSLERREAVRRRAAGVVADAAAAKGDPLAQLRRSTLASLEGVRLSGVRLEVHPGKAPMAATVHLSAEGPAPEILRLSGHVVRPGSGVILERIHLGPTRDGLLMELDGFSLGGRP